MSFLKGPSGETVQISVAIPARCAAPAMRSAFRTTPDPEKSCISTATSSRLSGHSAISCPDFARLEQACRTAVKSLTALPGPQRDALGKAPATRLCHSTKRSPGAHPKPLPLASQSRRHPPTACKPSLTSGAAGDNGDTVELFAEIVASGVVPCSAESLQALLPMMLAGDQQIGSTLPIFSLAESKGRAACSSASGAGHRRERRPGPAGRRPQQVGEPSAAPRANPSRPPSRRAGGRS